MKSVAIDTSINTVFFVGAGISLNPPTNFPIASDIISEIIKLISPDAKTFTKLQLLSDSQRIDRRSPNDYIRFEQLIYSIQQVADPDLTLLRMIGIFDQPNELHFLLADRALQGDIVITTNFDCLIEEAILNLGGNPKTVCTFQDFKNWETFSKTSIIPVFKIHGSYRKYTAHHYVESIDTIQATLSTITAGTSELVLPGEKRDFLERVTKDKQLVVAGYSGCDDLDIMPSFHFLKMSTLYWIFHKQSPSKTVDITDYYSSRIRKKSDVYLSSRDQYFKKILSLKPSPLKIIDTNTKTFLKRTFKYKKYRSIKHKHNYYPRKKFQIFLNSWHHDRLQELYLKFMLVGGIMWSLARYNEAYEYFLEAWKLSKLSKKTVDKALIAFLISRIAVYLGRKSEAVKWAQDSVNLLRPSNKRRTKALCWHQLGCSLYTIGKLDEALRWFKKCRSFSQKHNLSVILSYALHDSALVLQDRSKYNEAVALYNKSKEISSDEGDIRHVTFTLHQLGILHYEIGDFDKARDYFKKSLEISNLIGDFDQFGNSLYELSLVEFISGNILKCINDVRESIKIDNMTGRGEYTPVCWQQIGIALLELERLITAAKYLKKAEEGYLKLGDEVTLSELYSYMSLYFLQKNENKQALEIATDSLTLAEKYKISSFISRARFMIGLCNYILSNTKSGTADILDSIHFSMKNKINDVLLDQIYYASKFHILHIFYYDVQDAVKWVSAKYQEVGNTKRFTIIQDSLRNI